MLARLSLVVIVLCTSLLLDVAWTRQSEPGMPLSSPWMTIEVGIASSGAHETLLRQVLHNQFADKKAEIDLTVRPALPPAWSLTTETTLRALAMTRSARADISVTRITIKGITADKAKWDVAAARIGGTLLPNMTFEQKVAQVRSPGSMQRQCIELFRTALRGRKLEFPPASAQLGSSAAPLLDELVQIAADCPTATIEITGHTDSTGDEPANRSLSQARADAVAAYMIARGINADRLSVSGAGSSEPLVAENSTAARQINRRIDIELRFGQ